jgi:hypothetical protein
LLETSSPWPLTVILARAPGEDHARPSVVLDGKKFWLTDRPLAGDVTAWDPMLIPDCADKILPE